MYLQYLHALRVLHAVEVWAALLCESEFCGRTAKLKSQMQTVVRCVPNQDLHHRVVGPCRNLDFQPSRRMINFCSTDYTKWPVRRKNAVCVGNIQK